MKNKDCGWLRKHLWDTYSKAIMEDSDIETNYCDWMRQMYVNVTLQKQPSFFGDDKSIQIRCIYGHVPSPVRWWKLAISQEPPDDSWTSHPPLFAWKVVISVVYWRLLCSRLFQGAKCRVRIPSQYSTVQYLPLTVTVPNIVRGKLC